MEDATKLKNLCETVFRFSIDILFLFWIYKILGRSGSLNKNKIFHFEEKWVGWAQKAVNQLGIAERLNTR